MGLMAAMNGIKENLTADAKESDSLFERTRSLFAGASAFRKTKNYYYETHECDGETRKTPLDIKLTDASSKECVTMGVCPRCKTAFYCETYENRSF